MENDSFVGTISANAIDSWQGSGILPDENSGRDLGEVRRFLDRVRCRVQSPAATTPN